MQKLLIAQILIIIFSCNNNEIKSKQTEKILKVDSQIKDTSKQINLNDTFWIEDFRRLRTALFQDNIDSILVFCSFPLTNIDIVESLWNISNSKLGPLVPDYIDCNEKTYSIEDFKKYRHKIFPKEFIIGLMSIKSDSLHKYGAAYSSKPYKENGHIYVTFVKYSNEYKSMSMYLSEDNSASLKEGSPVWLNFKIIPDGHIVFTGISFAG